MALAVGIALVKFAHTTAQGSSAPLVPFSTQVGTGEIKTTNGSTAQATLVASSATIGSTPVSQLAWRIAVPSTAVATDLVYVTFGANPTATNAGFMCPSGTVNYFGVSAVDEKVAILGPA